MGVHTHRERDTHLIFQNINYTAARLTKNVDINFARNPITNFYRRNRCTVEEIKDSLQWLHLAEYKVRG